MRIGGNDERSRHDISALHHDLVSDAGARRIEVDALLFCERFNRAIFLLVGLVLVLNVVVEGEYQLFGIVNLFCANAFELTHHRGGVVVRHDSMRTNGNEVSGPQRAIWSLSEMALRDFFSYGLRHVTPGLPNCGRRPLSSIASAC